MNGVDTQFWKYVVAMFVCMIMCCAKVVSKGTKNFAAKKILPIISQEDERQMMRDSLLSGVVSPSL